VAVFFGKAAFDKPFAVHFYLETFLADLTDEFGTDRIMTLSL
jgi:hypothetical protein